MCYIIFLNFNILSIIIYNIIKKIFRKFSIGLYHRRNQETVKRKKECETHFLSISLLIS
jgi:hypothetical protein